MMLSNSFSKTVVKKYIAVLITAGLISASISLRCFRH